MQTGTAQPVRVNACQQSFLCDMPLRWRVRWSRIPALTCPVVFLYLLAEAATSQPPSLPRELLRRVHCIRTR